MDKLRLNLQKQKGLALAVLLGYITFNGCFVFPFSNERFPFDFSKAILVISCYGIIGMCFTGLLKKGRSFIVFISTLFFTIIGLICRYFLEYGEVSNTMNFIPINIALYLTIVPFYCTLAYWAIYKWCDK